MSAAQKRAVGTLIFGPYNIANNDPRQEKFQAFCYLFSESDVNHIKRVCEVFKKGVEVFRTQAYVEASIRPKHHDK
jgi:hypothetical protein